MGFSGCEFIFFSCTLPSPLKCDETVLELDLKTHTFNVTEASCEMPVPSAFALMRKKETRSWRHLAANPLGTIFFLSLPGPLSTCLGVWKHSSAKAAPWIGGTFDFRVPFLSPCLLSMRLFFRERKRSYILPLSSELCILGPSNILLACYFFFSQMKGRFNYLSVALLSSPKWGF